MLLSRQRDPGPRWREREGGDFVELIPPLAPRTADRRFRRWASEAGLNRSQMRRDVRRVALNGGDRRLCRYLVRRRIAALAPQPGPGRSDEWRNRVLPDPDTMRERAWRRHDAKARKRGEEPHWLAPEEREARRLGGEAAAGFVIVAGILTVLYVLATGALVPGGGAGLDEVETIRVVSIGGLAAAYVVSAVSLVSGWLYRRDRPPAFFAKQCGVLGGSLPCVTVLTLGVLYGDISTAERLVIMLLYGTVYCGIIREFVELPPTREELLEALKRFVSPRFP